MFWIKVACVVAAIAAFFFAKHSYDVGKERIGEARVQAKWDADKAERLRAFSKMTAEWTTEKLRADALQKEKDDARNIQANKAHARAAALPAADAGARFPGAARVVLNDFVADSTAPAGSPGKSAEGPAAAPADTTVGAVTEWGVTVVALYNVCRDSVIGWIDFYAALRAAQPEEASP